MFGYDIHSVVAVSAPRASTGAPIAWLIPSRATAETKVARKSILNKACVAFEERAFRRAWLMVLGRRCLVEGAWLKVTD